jgi:transposase-like protein
MSFDATSRKQQEIAKNKVLLLKEVATNNQARIVDIAKDVGISKQSAYQWLKEFSDAWVLTEDEPNFPEKLLYIHENNALPEDIPKITPHEIVQLKSVVDRMQGREDVPEEPPNPIDGSYRTMSQEHVPPYSGLFFADPASHVGFGYLEYNEISNPKSLL